jgi:uncharacterized PurR-regulated membrane protein YhhQ (DUF165 family)
MNRHTITAATAATFIALIAASNALTHHYGLIAGLFTAGTITAGLSLAARDAVRETGGLTLAVGCVVAGAVLSYAIAGPALAVASGVAFLTAELADTAVYEPLRKAGRLRAVTASQAAGAVVDTTVFLAIAGFPLWPATGWQVAVKLAVVLLPAAVVGGARAVLRHRLRTASA